MLPHAEVYNKDSDSKAVHVSQAGKRHPKPFLLGEHPSSSLLQEHVLDATKALPSETSETEASAIASVNHGVSMLGGTASHGLLCGPFCKHIDEAQLRRQLKEVTRRSLVAVRSSLVPALRCEHSTLYSLVAYGELFDSNGCSRA